MHPGLRSLTQPRTFAGMSSDTRAQAPSPAPKPEQPAEGFHSTIRLDVALDEQRIPERLRWQSSDGQQAEGGDTRAFLLAIWDTERRETLRIDLWNKDMQRDEMDLLVFQTLLTLSDSYQKANGDQDVADMLKEFGFAFGERTKLIRRAPEEGPPASGEGQLDLARLAAERQQAGTAAPQTPSPASGPSKGLPDLPVPGTAGGPGAPPPKTTAPSGPKSADSSNGNAPKNQA